jgi:AraC-like DNA-binding protein
MSRIQALDEISARIGAPTFLRWVDAPYGAAAAVVRFRHRGVTVDLHPSRTFRLILQLSSSEVHRSGPADAPSHDRVRAGSIITSFTEQPERIRITGAAETFHLLFSPELARACGADAANRLPQACRQLQAGAIKTLVAASLSGTETQLQQAVASVATLLLEPPPMLPVAAGGLAPGARRDMLRLIDNRLPSGLSVADLARAAHLSVHHFIKVCRHTEGLTPHALLTQKRVERSLELLFDGSATLDEVALRVGFSSPSHFISTFRRLTGTTPAAVRRAARD